MLRRLELGDLRRFQAYRHDPDVGRYQDWEPQPDHDATRLIEDMREVALFPRGAWVQLGIASGSTNELVGDIGVCVDADDRRAEIGFTLAREAQGLGLGTEAIRGLIAFIFERDRPRVFDARRSSRSWLAPLPSGRAAHSQAGIPAVHLVRLRPPPAYAIVSLLWSGFGAYDPCERECPDAAPACARAGLVGSGTGET